MRFFSCLTTIRCDVVEGQHKCESAARILQGFLLGEHVPLRNNSTDYTIPEDSTLFKQVQTILYYCQNDEKMLDNTIVKHMKKQVKVLQNKRI